jgi:hypothetical protein
MRGGKIVADGEARKVLTNPEILMQASLVPPQIAQIFLNLSDLGFPKEVIDVYEAREILLKTFGSREQ